MSRARAPNALPGRSHAATLRQANGQRPQLRMWMGKMGAAGVAARLLRRQPAVALFYATEQELARKYKGAIKFPCTSGLNLLGKRRDARTRGAEELPSCAFDFVDWDF